MSIRYFKCHTNPYPSYDLTVETGGLDELVLTWKNGPNGQSEPTATEVCVAFVTNTAAETCLTIPLNLTSYTVTIVDGMKQDIQVRLRRQNSSGYGEYTPYIIGTLG